MAKEDKSAPAGMPAGEGNKVGSMSNNGGWGKGSNGGSKSKSGGSKSM